MAIKVGLDGFVEQKLSSKPLARLRMVMQRENTSAAV
jgi:hypothetical protein